MTVDHDKLHNPLCPKNDSYQISSCNINTQSLEKVMRIENVITKEYCLEVILHSTFYRIELVSLSKTYMLTVVLACTTVSVVARKCTIG